MKDSRLKNRKKSKGSKRRKNNKINLKLCLRFQSFNNKRLKRLKAMMTINKAVVIRCFQKLSLDLPKN